MTVNNLRTKQKRSPFTLINKKTPPEKTFAEEYYYKKQMEGKTVMVIVLGDGEEVRGNIEWYDKDCLKINRHSMPNILLRKDFIKYMFKENEEKRSSSRQDAKLRSGTKDTKETKDIKETKETE